MLELLNLKTIEENKKNSGFNKFSQTYLESSGIIIDIIHWDYSFFVNNPFDLLISCSFVFW